MIFPLVGVLSPMVQLRKFPQETLPEVTPELILTCTSQCGIWIVLSPASIYTHAGGCGHPVIYKPTDATAQLNRAQHTLGPYALQWEPQPCD